MVKEYWNDVFVDMVAEYERGVTPNPDVWCNREIKFRALWDRVSQAGFGALATGALPHKRFE